MHRSTHAKVSLPYQGRHRTSLLARRLWDAPGHGAGTILSIPSMFRLLILNSTRLGTVGLHGESRGWKQWADTHNRHLTEAEQRAEEARIIAPSLKPISLE